MLATITLVNFVSALHGYETSMKEASRLFDEQLAQQLVLLQALSVSRLEREEGRFELPLILNNFKVNGVHANVAFQVLDQSGELLMRSDNSPQKAISELSDGVSENNFDGYRWHVLTAYHPESKHWFIVAERDDVRYHLAEAVIIESVLPIVFSLPVIGVMIWIIVSLGLKPLKELAEQLRKKEAADLSPITRDNVPKELALLLVSANELLKRLESSFNREKRFAADAAHELRTPIAALKMHVQNLLVEQSSSSGTLEKVAASVDRMSHLVEQILTLNRTTPDHYMAKFARVDLAEVARKVVADNIDMIDLKHQEISFEGESVEIYADPFAVETLVQNLLTNAVKYTPVDGQLLIRAFGQQGEAVLQLMDSGEGIPESEYDRVFERFYRVGGDRHRSAVIGCGLGLSIVKHIVDLHEARIKLSASDFDSGLCVTVIFPEKYLCEQGGRKPGERV